MGEHHLTDDQLYYVRNILKTEYADKEKTFYECIVPKDEITTCNFVGTFSDMNHHMNLHWRAGLYSCKRCTKQIYDPKDVYSHIDISRREKCKCTSVIAIQTCFFTTTDIWRARNVFIKPIAKEEYEIRRPPKKNVEEKNNAGPGTPAYEEHDQEKKDDDGSTLVRRNSQDLSAVHLEDEIRRARRNNQHPRRSLNGESNDRSNHGAVMQERITRGAPPNLNGSWTSDRPPPPMRDSGPVRAEADINRDLSDFFGKHPQSSSSVSEPFPRFSSASRQAASPTAQTSHPASWSSHGPNARSNASKGSSSHSISSTSQRPNDHLSKPTQKKSEIKLPTKPETIRPSPSSHESRRRSRFDERPSGIQNGQTSQMSTSVRAYNEPMTRSRTPNINQSSSISSNQRSVAGDPTPTHRSISHGFSDRKEPFNGRNSTQPHRSIPELSSAQRTISSQGVSGRRQSVGREPSLSQQTVPPQAVLGRRQSVSSDLTEAPSQQTRTNPPKNACHASSPPREATRKRHASAGLTETPGVKKSVDELATESGLTRTPGRPRREPTPSRTTPSRELPSVEKLTGKIKLFIGKPNEVNGGRHTSVDYRPSSRGRSISRDRKEEEEDREQRRKELIQQQIDRGKLSAVAKGTVKVPPGQCRLSALMSNPAAHIARKSKADAIKAKLSSKKNGYAVTMQQIRCPADLGATSRANSSINPLMNQHRQPSTSNAYHQSDSLMNQGSNQQASASNGFNSPSPPTPVPIPTHVPPAPSEHRSRSRSQSPPPYTTARSFDDHERHLRYNDREHRGNGNRDHRVHDNRDNRETRRRDNGYRRRDDPHKQNNRDQTNQQRKY